jgi:hypothetical protein
VLWVRLLASTTRSTNSAGSSADTAMPTGAIRIAAPLVVP